MSKSEKADQFPLVSILILNLNGMEHLEQCLNSVLVTNYPNFEIFLIDNNSVDNSVDFVTKNFPHVKIIRNKKNLGFAAANNIGIRCAQGKYVILLNNDTEVEKNWITELVEIAESDSTIAACQPKVLDYYNRKKFEYAGAAGGFIDIYGYPLCRGRIFEYIEIDHGQYDDIVNVFWATGAAMLLKRKILEKTGLLDETFFIYHEETDLCWRIHLSGYKVVYVPTAKVFHKGGATYKKKPYKSWYLLHRNNLIMLLKNYNRHNVLKYFIPRVVLEEITLCKYLQERDIKRVIVIVRSILWVLRNLKEILNKRYQVQLKIRTVSDAEVMKYMVKKSTSILFFTSNIKTFESLKRYF